MALEAAAAGVRPPRPADWGKITRGQREHRKRQSGRSRESPGHGEPWLDVRTHFRYLGGGVGFVDSASEKTKARTVVEIYLEPGVIPIPGLHPSDTTKTFILFATPMQTAVPQRTAQPSLAAGAAAVAATATAVAGLPRSAVSGGAAAVAA